MSTSTSFDSEFTATPPPLRLVTPHPTFYPTPPTERPPQSMAEAIFVMGEHVYMPNNWGNAIAHFLGDLPKGDTQEIPRIKFESGNFAIQLNPERGQYIAYGTPRKREPMFYPDHVILRSSGKQNEMASAMRRFVNEDGIFMLVLTFESGGVVEFWKTNSGRLGMRATNILVSI